MSKGLSPETFDLARLWARVEIPPGPGWKKRCWTWKGRLSKHSGTWRDARLGGDNGGYPHFDLYRDGKTKTVRGHRWLYEQLHGPIPAGLVVRHTCDNRACMNPAHHVLEVPF